VAGLDDLRAQLVVRSHGLVVLLAVSVSACDANGPRAAAASPGSLVAAEQSDRDRARQDSILRSSPGYVIDSILPIGEEIRRFQADLGERPPGFSYGSPSQAGLVEAFVRSIEHNDTTSLVRLMVNRREFGFLVYPTSPNVSPPYRQSPQLVWLQRAAASSKGASRLLERLGGRPLGFVSYTCPSSPSRQGENTVWMTCVVRLVGAGGDTTTHRLFGPIIERGGQYKFLSLTTDL